MKWKRWRNLTRLFPNLDLRGIDFVTIRRNVEPPEGARPITDKQGRPAMVCPMQDAGRRGLAVYYLPADGTPDDGDEPASADGDGQ